MRALLLPLLCAAAAGAAVARTPDAQRAQELTRMVRNDCGACHGIHLTGGLGPSITRQALAGQAPAAVAATIYHGRPGTPMPPWSAMLDEDEALWIARRLLDGLPEQASQ